MDNTEAGSSFVGTLVRRQYKPGQRYIQLVFETPTDTKLSLSRNLDMVRSLKVGETYRIEGAERLLGNKKYIYEPVAIPLPRSSKKSRTLRFAAFGGVACLLIAGGVITSAQLRDEPVRTNTVAQHNSTNTKAPVTATNDGVETTDTSTVQAAESSTTAPKPTAKTKPTTASGATTTNNAPKAPGAEPELPTNPVVPPPAEDCVTEAVAFTTVTVPDETQPEGTVLVEGQDGQNKVCYPNGRSSAAVVTPVTAPVNKQVVVHPPVS